MLVLVAGQLVLIAIQTSELSHCNVYYDKIFTLFLSATCACNNPGTIQNGVQQPTLNTYPCNTVITYNCNFGFTMVGSGRLTCLSSNRWSGAIPTCQQQQCTCGNPPGLQNGFLNPSQGPYNCNSFVTYQCNSGYRLVGSDRIQCQSNRAWGGSAPFCQQQVGKCWKFLYFVCSLWKCSTCLHTTYALK